MSGELLTKYSYRCCLVGKKVIIVKPGWSYFCKKCGRYNYDQPGWSLNLKESIKRMKIFLNGEIKDEKIKKQIRLLLKKFDKKY